MTPHPPRARYGDLLRPSLRVAAVQDIDLALLAERGVKGLIFDLDDTLVRAMEPHAHPDIVLWLDGVRARFAAYIVSNNMSHQRVVVASEHLGLPYLSRARKPSRRSLRVAVEAMALAPAQVAIIGDQLFTDVLGGNRLGAMTILVDPLSTCERRWYRRVMRSAETYMLSRTESGTP